MLDEAILTKTPVLASDIGGVSELIKDSKNGFLFNPGDSEEFYKHMRDSIENQSLIQNSICNSNFIKNIADNAREMEKVYASFTNYGIKK